MPTLEIEFRVDGIPAEEVLERLADVEGYAAHSEAIQDISVQRESADAAVSFWNVDFHGGQMEWSQRDEVDREKLELRFSQIEGDSDVWEGSWRVVDTGAAVAAAFRADYDLGLPSLADQLNPLAASALYGIIVEVVEGMFGAAGETLTPRPGATAGRG
jgi:Polyketide cyclase / dehydrase and lipid transport